MRMVRNDVHRVSDWLTEGIDCARPVNVDVNTLGCFVITVNEALVDDIELQSVRITLDTATERRVQVRVSVTVVNDELG